MAQARIAWSWPLVLGLVLACSPAAHPRTQPGGPRLSAELVAYGQPEQHLCILRIPRREGEPAWQGAFTDGSPEILQTEDLPGQTLLKWPVASGRMATLTRKPYQLRIQNGKQAFEVTLTFTSEGRDFVAKFLLQLIAAGVR